MNRKEEYRRLIAYGYTPQEIHTHFNMQDMLKRFPGPDCESGYSWDYLEEIMDHETFVTFSRWMNGQTCTICDGRRYNHGTREYEPTECAANPHGGVAYTWDVERFLGIHGQAAKDLWD